MADKIATRNAYGQALADLGDKYKKFVVLDADLSGSTMTKFFAEKYPERFFNCGIAEANMTGIAAGFATCGYKAFTDTFAVFAAGRAFEQVRNSIAYPKLNVVVVGSHGGISVGEDGATHQSVEDLAIMRDIPNMLVCNPADANEMKLAVEALLNFEGPAYLRLQRLATEVFTDTIDGYDFKLGKSITLKEGNDVTIIATGLTVAIALSAAKELEKENISARVIDMHTIKPLDEEAVLKAAKETKCIVTTEEHSIVGGLGGAVCELVSGTYPVPVIRHGVNDEFGRSGEPNAVLEYYKITAEEIAKKAKEAIKLKK